eukprot:scaffold699_cov385-Prasinococcus_capsulatus_cf.AAC.28
MDSQFFCPYDVAEGEEALQACVRASATVLIRGESDEQGCSLEQAKHAVAIADDLRCRTLKRVPVATPTVPACSGRIADAIKEWAGMSEADLKKRRQIDAVFSRPGMGASAQQRATTLVKQRYEEHLRQRDQRADNVGGRRATREHIKQLLQGDDEGHDASSDDE